MLIALIMLLILRLIGFFLKVAEDYFQDSNYSGFSYYRFVRISDSGGYCRSYCNYSLVHFWINKKDISRRRLL